MDEKLPKKKYSSPLIIQTYKEDELMDSATINATYTYVVTTGSNKGSGYQSLL
jgi:hypothetical protein